MFLTVRTNPEAHVVHVSTNYLFLLIRNQSLCNTVHVPFTANINLLWPFVACKWVEFHTVDINYEFWWWRIWTKGIKPWDVLRGLLSSLVFDQIYYVLRQLFWTKTYLESVENILRCNSGTTVCVNMLLVSLLTQVIFWKKKPSTQFRHSSAVQYISAQKTTEIYVQFVQVQWTAETNWHKLRHCLYFLIHSLEELLQNRRLTFTLTWRWRNICS